MNGQCLSQLQTEELKLLKVFIKLCDENNLTYFVAGGSFLGAVRHQGFIPWDDDIDVAMPRPDLKNLLRSHQASCLTALSLVPISVGKSMPL